MRLLLRLNHGLRTVVERIFPQPESGLLQGVLLGVDDVLRRRRLQLPPFGVNTHPGCFRIQHQCAAPDDTLWLRKIRRQLALMVAMAGITVFGLMVGFSAPVHVHG